jgi:hypothetical protein
MPEIIDDSLLQSYGPLLPRWEFNNFRDLILIPLSLACGERGHFRQEKTSTGF